MRAAFLVLVLALGLVLTGCGAVLPGRAVAATTPPGDLALIHAYVDGLNAAARAGPAAQTAYLRATQEPATPPPPPDCLGRVTLETRLVDRTLRPDLDFLAPRPGAPPAHPDGAVYVVAAQVNALLDGVSVREQVGSKHLVVRGGRVFGYAPCPS